MQVIYDNRKYCVNLDWLSFSVRLNEPEPELNCPDGYRLEILPGNNIYKNRFILRDAAGRKLITALWCPYSSVLEKRIATIQYANATLYTEERFKLWDLLLQVWDCEFNGMSRIDICCDFNPTDFQHGIMRRLGDGRCYVQGKREGSKFWHEKTTDRLQKRIAYHCMSWGSKSSEIKCKLYWKSREQGLIVPDGVTAIPDKPYIVEEWREWGMDVKDVWRIEFSLQSSGQLRFDGRCLSLDDVLLPHWFCRVMSYLLDSRFVIRRNDGKRTPKHNFDRIVEFVRLPFDKLDFRWKDYDTKHYEDADNITLVRKLIQQLDSPVCATNSIVFDAVANALLTAVYSCHLDGYVRQKVGQSVDDYIAAQRELCGLGIVEVTPKPNQLD